MTSKAQIQQTRHAVEKYQDSVLSGKRLAGRLERLAIERHRRDLADGKERGLWFSWEHADYWVRHFPKLKHSRGAAARQAFELVPAQKNVVATGMGWRRRDTGHRRFTRWLYSIARGGGKSPFVAALGVGLMTADVPFAFGAELLNTATTLKQAKKYVWNQGRDFMQARSSLRSRASFYQDRIEFRREVDGEEYTSTWSPLGADGHNADGGGPLYVAMDELHAFRTEAHRELVEKIEGGMGKVPQSLLIYATTAGSDRSYIWREKHDYAVKLLEGIIDDDSFFPYVFAADPEDDPLDRKMWIKANPLLGLSVTYDTYRDDALKAKASPSAMNWFKRYRLNYMVSSLSKLIAPELWRKGSAPLIDLRGRKCHIAVDLGFRNDLAAVVLVFPIEGDDGKVTYYVIPQAWLPRDTERGEKCDQKPWSDFIASGTLKLTDDDTTDIDAITDYVVACSKIYDVQTVAADPHNARQFLTTLKNTHGLDVFEFTQSAIFYHEPLKTCLDLLAQGRLIHAGDRLLAWSADNVVAKEDARGYMMPAKNKSADKIDLFVALIMALSECLYAEKKPVPRARVVQW